MIKPQRLKLAVALLTALQLVSAPHLFAHSGATGVVKERMERMQQMKESMKILAEIAKQQRPYDMQQIAQAAGTIDRAADGLAATFPAGSLMPPSEATEQIWNRWNQFTRLATNLQQQAKTLADADGALVPQGFKREFARLARTCRSCHSDFRRKKEQGEHGE